jgi:predicted HicB family RNase H-like nuclease
LLLDNHAYKAYIGYNAKHRGGYMHLFIKGFPDDLHRETKIQAAVEGISIKELVIRAVRDYLKKQKKGKGS